MPPLMANEGAVEERRERVWLETTAGGWLVISSPHTTIALGSTVYYYLSSASHSDPDLHQGNRPDYWSKPPLNSCQGLSSYITKASRLYARLGQPHPVSSPIRTDFSGSGTPGCLLLAIRLFTHTLISLAPDGYGRPVSGNASLSLQAICLTRASQKVSVDEKILGDHGGSS